MIDRAVVENARKDAAFGRRAWITFYLRGDPEKHAAMVSGLVALKAENLGRAEGGSVYAKVPVLLNQTEIEERVSQVRSLAAEAGVEIDIIDLDSTPDVPQSKFFTLWTAPAD